jgi:hypothetical protein
LDSPRGCQAGGLSIANQRAIFTATLAEHAEQDVRDAGYFDQARVASQETLRL